MIGFTSSYTDDFIYRFPTRMCLFLKFFFTSLGLYCNATWDGAMCWDFTSAGSTAKQHCAKYIPSFNPSGI
jgi:hypothetical protein